MAQAPKTPRGLQPPDAKPVRITVPKDKVRYGDPFFPKIPFQAIFYISAIFGVLIFLALTSPAPLEDPADPLNHAAIDPKPEWYFMFLFQLLKYFSGPFIVVGAVIIPTIIVILLLLLPFYDRNWAREIARRPIAVLSMGGGMLLIIFLTWGGFGFPKPSLPEASSPSISSPPGQPALAISPAVAQIFQAHCASCHINGAPAAGVNLANYSALQAGGTGTGPVVVPGNHEKSILWQVIQPGGNWPGGARMPLGGPYLSSADITTIAAWIDGLGKPTAAAGGAKISAPVSYKKEVQPIFNTSCSMCHISTSSAGVNLSNHESLMKGSSVGPLVQAGDHTKSVLWQVIQPGGNWPGGARMPLSGSYLNDKQIQTIATWIDQGAKDN